MLYMMGVAGSPQATQETLGLRMGWAGDARSMKWCAEHDTWEASTGSEHLGS